MAVFHTKQILRSLQEDTQQTIHLARKLMDLTDTELNRYPAPGKWSIVQIIEHLNSYNRYYLPQIENVLRDAGRKAVPHNPLFHPGFFGNYFTKMMQPSQDGVKGKTYKAPKDHIPPPCLDSVKVMEEFIRQQHRLAEFLQKGMDTDIGRLKVPVSISRFIKLKLGDTFRFLIAHQQRHFMQIEAIEKNMKISN